MFKLNVHFKCTRLSYLISRNLLYLNVFPAPNRCVWCDAVLGQLPATPLGQNGWCKYGYICRCNFNCRVNRGERSHLSEAKERATGTLVQVVYFLNGRSPLRMLAASVAQVWAVGVFAHCEERKCGSRQEDSEAR